MVETQPEFEQEKHNAPEAKSVIGRIRTIFSEVRNYFSNIWRANESGKPKKVLADRTGPIANLQPEADLQLRRMTVRKKIALIKKIGSLLRTLEKITKETWPDRDSSAVDMQDLAKELLRRTSLHPDFLRGLQDFGSGKTVAQIVQQFEKIVETNLEILWRVYEIRPSKEAIHGHEMTAKEVLESMLGTQIAATDESIADDQK